MSLLMRAIRAFARLPSAPYASFCADVASQPFVLYYAITLRAPRKGIMKAAATYAIADDAMLSCRVIAVDTYVDAIRHYVFFDFRLPLSFAPYAAIHAPIFTIY